MPGVTEQGFEAMRLADVVSVAEAELATIVDSVSGFRLQPDFSGADPSMQVVKTPLDAVGEVWDMSAELVDQFDPSKAIGPSLRGLVQLNGLSAQLSTRSTAPAALGGSPGAPVAAGTLVTDTQYAHQWATKDLVILDGGGAGAVTVECVDAGAITAVSGTLTRIVTNVPGLTSVTNTADATPGQPAEDDEDLRQRRDRSTAAPASGPIESVRANIANIPGVAFARLFQNLTLVTDARGIPGRTIAPVVVGGDDEAIGRVLLQRTGTGADTYGSSSFTFYDTLSEPYVMRWTRPAPVQIYVKFTLSIEDSKAFPFDGLQQIRNNIVAYALGGARALGIQDGFNFGGFVPGGLIGRTLLFTPINIVPGQVSSHLQIGLSLGAVDDVDIQLDWNKYPVFTADDAHIEIDIV